MLGLLFFVGFPETGKSTTANLVQTHIEHRVHIAQVKHFMKLDPRAFNLKIYRESMVKEAGPATQRMFGATHVDYETFKRAEFYGRSGREWIISVVEQGLRAHDQHILNKMLLARVINDGLYTYDKIIILENLGFESEYKFFADWIKQEERSNPVEMIIVNCIRPGRDEGFAGDSRQNLAKYANITIDSPLRYMEVVHLLQARNWPIPD